MSKKQNISLGMNRLAVIDIKQGNQPIFSENKEIIGFFNGCIFNFKEIKKYLVTKKINFKTNSDTEVLVNSFHFGEKNVLIILMECGQLVCLILKKRINIV